MTGEKKIVGLWGNQNPSSENGDQLGAADQPARPVTGHASFTEAASEATEAAALVASAASEEIWPEDSAQFADNSGKIGWGFGGLALLWAGYSLYASTNGFTTSLSAQDRLMLAVAITAPAAMLLLLWHILRHNGSAEQRRFHRLSASLREENAALTQSLMRMNDQLSEAQRQLREQVHLVQKLGFDAAIRLNESSDILASRVQNVTEVSTILERNADSAMLRMEGLLNGLPRIDDVATRLASNFREAGLVAHQQGAQLEAHLASLDQEAASAAQSAQHAASELEKALTNLRALSDDTQNGLAAASAKVSETQSQTLAAMSRGTAAMRQELQMTTEQLSENVENLWKKFRSEIDDAGTALSQELDKADNAAATLKARLDAQTEKTANISTQMATMVDDTREQLASLNAAINQSSEHIERAVDHSKNQLASFSVDLGVGNRSAQQLITHSEALLLALDAVTRELDETLPLAFDRLKQHEDAAQQSAAKLKPLLEASELVAQSTLSHIHSAEKSIENNTFHIRAQGEQQLQIQEKAQSEIAKSEQSIHQLKQAADEFTAQSAAQMIAAISRVQDMAELVTSEVRANFGAISEESRNALHGHAVSAIDEAFRAEITAQLEAIELASHRAVTAANGATERLTRQLHTIVEASEAVELRTSEAEQAIIAFDRDTLAKQVGLLTEALKSTAIDMTKILSSDVSDTAWEAYLRGDRGVFARRAVKLVDHSDAREILRLYQNDSAFNASVNQFIHDFEAMLRLLMNARDGSAISVTLLSSDIGKLYVALAQAIDRLRN